MLAGQQLPAGLGFSTVEADFDFETFSAAGFVWDAEEQKWIQPAGLGKQSKGLGAVGVRNYVEHPTFQLLCLSYNLKDGYGPASWRPDMLLPTRLFDHIRAGKILEAWNVGFEYTVWEYHCVPKLGWPPLDPELLRCAMAKSRAFSFPGGLANAGPAVLGYLPGAEVLFKDSEGSKLMKKLTTPRNPTKRHPALRWTPESAPLDFEKFYAYNVQDIIAESAVSEKIPDLSPRELRIWKTSERVNQRGMAIDRVAVENNLAIVEQSTDKYNAELRGITNGHVSHSSKVADTIAWFATRGVYLPNLDEDTVEENLLKPHDPAILRILKIRQLLSFGSVKKLYAMRHQVCSDGRLRDQYAYHAAHTSLWNGQNVQMANLYKGKLDKPEKVDAALAALASRSLDYVEAIYGDALETVADCLRSMVIAGPGMELISADYSAIQAVVTSCLAREQWRIDVFKTHGKIYEAMASRLTGIPFDDYLSYRKMNNKHHDDRQLGKLAALSADFGAWIPGWKRFGAEKYGDDIWLKQTILKVRAAQPAVTELWGGQVRNKFQWDERAELYGLEGAAVAAVLNPGTCYGYNGVRYQVHNDVLYCQPPTNGSPLVYHEPRLEPSQREYARPWELELSYMGWNSNQTKGKGGWVRMKLYGGVLTQNVVAKCAREYQADAMVSCEAEAYPWVMHTHDEGVAEVPEGTGSTDAYLEIVNRKPSWAVLPDGTPWPVKAPDAWRGKRFGKWD